MMYGFDFVDAESFRTRHPYSDLASTPDEWRSAFNSAVHEVRKFLEIHDSMAILAKCINQAMAVAASRKENPRWFMQEYEPYELIEPADMEFLQALMLAQTSPLRKAPASPRSMHRFLSEVPKCGFAFIRMQPLRYPDNPERDHLISKIRLQTMYYRNHFIREDCETVVSSILQLIDELTLKEIGSKLSETFAASVALVRVIESRLNEYMDQGRNGLQANSIDEALKSIEYFCAISLTARRAWSKCKNNCNTLDDFRWAAFQLSELCHAWPCTFDEDDLRQSFGNAAVDLFVKLSIQIGDLAERKFEHFLLDNPVWRRPFIRVDEKTLFLPLPNLFYGFPFKIFEQLLNGNRVLENAYYDARGSYLENAIADQLSTAMPSAKIYRKVMWRDAESGVLYENDVVVLIGNTIFLFEAKSGKLDDAARRGGELSLLRNFKELFVEPGEQARRLERYLQISGKDARLWIKDTNEIVALDLEKPKIVHKFSVCIEHFASLTSAKKNLRTLGAIKDEDAWAPVLSLGELMLIGRHLDTEVSFHHYLTRRATLEDQIDFEGDEQDILSLYLTNGFNFDPEDIKGQQLSFLNMDGIVRVKKTPRANRREFEIFGIPLNHYWRSTLKEIYKDDTLRHHFDILQVILNQGPQVLFSIDDQLRKWRRGLRNNKQHDVITVRNTIGNRVFVLIYHLTKKALDEAEWAERARTLARNLAASMFDATDCAVILCVKKSRETTYDGISFHRLAKRAKV